MVTSLCFINVALLAANRSFVLPLDLPPDNYTHARSANAQNQTSRCIGQGLKVCALLDKIEGLDGKRGEGSEATNHANEYPGTQHSAITKSLGEKHEQHAHHQTSEYIDGKRPVGKTATDKRMHPGGHTETQQTADGAADADGQRLGHAG